MSNKQKCFCVYHKMKMYNNIESKIYAKCYKEIFP
jgi:hypothetical protein